MSSRRGRRKANLVNAGGTGGSSGGAVLERLSAIVIKLTEKVMGLEKALHARVSHVEQVARAADYRSVAIQKLLDRAGISEGDVLSKLEQLQVEEFDRASSKDDATRGLVSDDTGEVTTDSTVIIAVQYQSGDTVISGSGVLRSKLELSQANTVADGLQEALVGKRVGDTVRVPVKLDGSDAIAEIRLLGLRKKAVEPGIGSA